ncbi:MAG: type II toxin-antitoxin system VapC family toxin [Actinomycetota bacterium]
MTVVVDTSALLAYFDRGSERHAAVEALVDAEREPLAVNPLVLAEVDHLVRRRFGERAADGVLREIAGGAYDIAAFGHDDLRAALAVLTRYPDRRLGLTDASLLALAERVGATTVFTLDRRDFDGLVRGDGTPLTILP